MDSQLVGAWRLVEWTSSRDGGPVSHPLGDDASGRLLYLSSGWMSAHLSRADGHSDGLSYCGTWERLAGEEVVHRVELSTRASFVGTDLLRAVSWEGPDLVLTTPPRDGWVAVLRWRRADG
jgi:Lipocalin-like domain